MSFNYPSGPAFFGVSVLPSVLCKQQRKDLNTSSLKISYFIIVSAIMQIIVIKTMITVLFSFFLF